MLKIAVVTRYFPSSAEPWQGRSAYQTLRVIAREPTCTSSIPTPHIHPYSSPEAGSTIGSTPPTAAGRQRQLLQLCCAATGLPAVQRLDGRSCPAASRPQLRPRSSSLALSLS